MRYINKQGQFYDGKPITVGDRTYISPSAEILALAGYYPYTPPEPTAEELLEAARYSKLAEIAEYDMSENVNSFSLAGQSMWLDSDTRQQLRTSIEAYQAQGAETVTKWFGGHQFSFPVSLWIAMLNALEVYAAEALNVTESHKAAVMALTTIEEIEAYDHTTGYPQLLTLTPEWLQSLS